jgi:hypothetical protein
MPVGCYRYHAFKIIHHAYMYVHTKCGIDGVYTCLVYILIYKQVPTSNAHLYFALRNILLLNTLLVITDTCIIYINNVRDL